MLLDFTLFDLTTIFVVLIPTLILMLTLIVKVNK